MIIDRCIDFLCSSRFRENACGSLGCGDSVIRGLGLPQADKDLPPVRLVSFHSGRTGTGTAVFKHNYPLKLQSAAF